MIKQAYNLTMAAQRAQRGSPDCHGWSFGLPPGISSMQWPLDPVTGYPLAHGFTLLLPEDYRIHGPEIVALSFFATAFDQNDGGGGAPDELSAAVIEKNTERPSDPELMPFWQAAQTAHARLFRMEDILGYGYALILLTDVEFNGPLCQPPALAQSSYLDANPPPRWLEKGTAKAYHQGYGDEPADPTTFITRQFGGPPSQGAVDFALRWQPRSLDPNAGRAPREDCAEIKSEYQLPSYFEGGVTDKEHHREHEWVKGHEPNHIGGTMRPVQNIPEFSPYYIEFEEDFGGYNFGGGNAQLDFRDMKFDWACG